MDEDGYGFKNTRNMQTQVQPNRKDFYCQVYPARKVVHDIGVQTDNEANCVVEAIPQTEALLICDDVMPNPTEITPSAISEQKAIANDVEMGTQSLAVFTPETAPPHVPDYVREEVVVEEVDTTDHDIVSITPYQSSIDAKLQLSMPTTVHADVPLCREEQLVLRDSANVEPTIQAVIACESSPPSTVCVEALAKSEVEIINNEADDKKQLHNVQPSESSPACKGPPGGGSYPLLHINDNEDDDKEILKVIILFLNINMFL
jgi:hypothetical protein